MPFVMQEFAHVQLATSETHMWDVVMNVQLMGNARQPDHVKEEDA